MSRKSLKNSTAMLLCAAMAIPQGVMAQQMSEDEISRICPDAALQATCTSSLLSLIEGGAIELDAEGKIVTDIAVAEDGTVTVVDGNATAETASEVETGGDQAQAETEAEVETGAETAGVASEAEAEIAEPEPEAEAVATEVEADAPEVQPDAQAATDTDTNVANPDTAEVEVEAEADGQTTAEAEPAAESIETEQAEAGEVDAEPEQSETVEANDVTTAIDNGDVVEPIVEGAKTVEVDDAQLEVAQEDTEESAAAANETPQVAAAAESDTEAEAEVETTTTVVEEGEVRSSSEDFQTQASAAPTSGDDNDNLRDFAKIALGVAGAVAISKLLKDNERVVSNSGDRLVVEQDGQYRVLKNDDVLLRQPGSEVQTRTFSDGSTQTTITRPNGIRVVTIRAADGQVLRRSRILADGTEIVLFDDTQEVEPVNISELPTARPASAITRTEDLRAALAAAEARDFNRRFTLQQVREIRAVRELMPEIELQAVNFDTGSAAIRASEAEELRDLGLTMRDMIEENPNEVFLVEGHTDAVGRASYNLALSDRRAESVALALTEYFDVPPESMVVQGYGEANLKVPTLQAERANRRATVRRITPLLQSADLN